MLVELNKLILSISILSIDALLLLSCVVFCAAVLFIWWKSAPIRSSLEHAQRIAFEKMKLEGQFDVAINSQGDLRKIPLETNGTFNLKNFRVSAERYVKFIDRTNQELRKSIGGDAASFILGGWICGTIAALSFLVVVNNNQDSRSAFSAFEFIIDMNANALSGFFYLPQREVDPISGSGLDLIAIVPYAFLLALTGLPGIIAFTSKYLFNLRPKWAATRKMLTALLEKDSDETLNAELTRIRIARDAGTEKPWYTIHGDIVDVATQVIESTHKPQPQ